MRSTASAFRTGPRRPSLRASGSSLLSPHPVPAPAAAEQSRADAAARARRTCPLCRQKWNDSASATQGGSAAGPSYTAEGYENYAAMAGISTKRDTSSCAFSSSTLPSCAALALEADALSPLADHQGPRRGRDGGWRFGYDDDWNGGFGYM